MTNKGVVGFPAVQGVSRGQVPAPLMWGGYLQSGYYYWVGGAASSGSSSTLGNGTLRLHPYYIPNKVTLTRIGSDIATAGESNSLLRLGVYTDDGTGYPGALLLDAGAIAGDSNTVQEINIGLTLDPGLYWVGGAVQAASTTQPTVRIVQNGSAINLRAGTSVTAGTSGVGFSQTSVSGALPAVFTTTTTLAGNCPRLHVKVA